MQWLFCLEKERSPPSTSSWEAGPCSRLENNMVSCLKEKYCHEPKSTLCKPGRASGVHKGNGIPVHECLAIGTLATMQLYLTFYNGLLSFSTTNDAYSISSGD